MRKLDAGPLTTGSRVYVSQARLRPGIWRILDQVEGQSFAWGSSQPGVRTAARHEVSVDSDGRTRITLGIEQSGLLARVIDVLLGARVRHYVDLELAGLTAASEAGG